MVSRQFLVPGGVRFGDISHVLIDLRINRSGTTIPSIVLVEGRALDQSSASLNLEYILEIDQ